MDSDPNELRAEWLFDFAYVLHIPAPVVDTLRFLDFCQYIVGLRAYREAKEKAAASNG